MRASLFASRRPAAVLPSAHAGPPGTSRRRLGAALLVTALLLLGLALASSAEATVYWGNTAGTSIGRASNNGTGVSQNFIGGGSQPGAVAVDGAHVYWANDLTHTIGRANLDGTGVNQRFITGVSTDALAVDGAHIYWPTVVTSTPGGDAIGRANINGTGVNQRFITGATNPSGIAVDGGHVYWGNEGSRTIGRANLDGTAANQRFISGLGNVSGVAVDAAHVYWTNVGNVLIGRANLDGTGVNPRFITNAGDAFGVAVDAGHLYWTNGHVAGDSAIGRANLDGTEVIPRFIIGASSPEGVAVDGRTVGGVQDTTPPETTISSGPSGTVTSSSATFAFAANEANATFECRLDGGSWAPCASPKSYTALLLGSHTFDVRATDPTGNVDATPASRTWTAAGTGPANDLFASARAISGRSGTTTGTSVGATKEVGEPDHVGNPGGSSVWFAWTAPVTGTVTFDTIGSTFDTLLAAYTGSAVNALTQTAANDDASGVQSRISFTAVAGTTYRLAIDGYFGDSGPVTLNWSQP
jgi:virginiamycin B lyase